MSRRSLPILHSRLQRSLCLLVLLALAAVVTACGSVTSLLGPQHSVADLLASPPPLGKTLYVDAYVSQVDSAAAASSGIAAMGQASGASGQYTILADRPFYAKLSLLGGALPNALPADAPWLIVAAPANAPTLARLPYHGRFRGHLESGATAQGLAARVFVIEQVVRTYEAQAPAISQDIATWQRYQDTKSGYSVPIPPGWSAEMKGEDLEIQSSLYPEMPITVRVHAGETHDDPYDVAAAPPLLQGQNWTSFAQSMASGQGGLAGYRIDHAESNERSTAVLFSAHGHTYELSIRFPLGFAAPQAALTAYSAVVAGFTFDTPPEPSPTPPVRQAVGTGPFLSEEAALAATCNLLGGTATSFSAQLISEAEARKLFPDPASFQGHFDGIWSVTVNTPNVAKGGLRLLLDARTGRELCQQEIDPSDQEPFDGSLFRLDELVDGRPQRTISRGERWIEVDIGQQTATAWEGNRPVRRMTVSTGIAQYPTVTGQFRIYYKVSSMTMTGPGYSLPGVPNVMFFYQGYGLHGAYWHWSFGQRVSHGCVNMTLPDAAWLFNWTDPQLPAGAYSVMSTPCNPGTLVVVHE